VLTVSKGPEPVTVPQLVPLSLEEATEQLAAIDISVVTTEEYSDTVPEGKVISQSIEQGTQAFRGDEATLVVSLGMPYVEVPSVITKPVAEARAELEAAGFKVDVSYWLGLFGNEVREQSAAPGSELRKGSTITLKL
jgi:beta-lactam-binding protein with PASTA domain